MTTEISAREEEMIRAAEAQGEDTFGPTAPAIERGAPGMTATYIPPQDKAAWLPAWELFVNRWGEEYGVAKRLPRGQLGFFLNLRRIDGGFRFTVVEPPRLATVGKYPCFIGDCRKRLPDKVQLVAHIENIHPQESLVFKGELERIRRSVAIEDVRVAAMISDIVDSTGEEPTAPASTESGVCPDCGWTSKPGKQVGPALRAHKRFGCPGGKT